jgi:hydrogenase-4 component B
MFALLFTFGGTLDFADWPRAMQSPVGDAIFALALIGFGLKAGAMPLHVWLPGAHANTPSHVSALMSGALIKMGIYGILRITSMCATPPLWWGYAVLVVGVVSAVLGVAFAIGQHDLKRLLAYHSVENIGIILMGLGVALLGRAQGRGDWVALGLAGALLHTWNHGLFKALLFLSAGSVLHATGTREIDRLGGLWRRMPSTALAFLVGAVAICGLPPLNGLISELLVYLGLFGVAMGGESWMAGAVAAPALALVGALALACFVKVVGMVFLGEPRSGAVATAHEASRVMLAPMAVLAGCCALIGVGAPLVAPVLDRAVAAWSSPGAPAAPALVELAPLAQVSLVGVALLLALAVLGAWLIARTRATPAAVGTWDCGYAAPSAHMQYTSSSFAQMIVRMFGWALRPDAHPPKLDGVFPASASFHSHVPDTVLDRGIRPLAGVLARAFAWVRPMQRGSIHLYLLYILGTLLALLVLR